DPVDVALGRGVPDRVVPGFDLLVDVVPAHGLDGEGAVRPDGQHGLAGAVDAAEPLLDRFQSRLDPVRACNLDRHAQVPQHLEGAQVDVVALVGAGGVPCGPLD